MKKMYLVKQGWNSSQLYEHRKDAMNALESLELGLPMESEYINEKGTFYKIKSLADRELSVSVVMVYTQDEIDALKPDKSITEDF